MANTNRPNLVLTGFIGTGKSAVAQRIATLSGREFVDMRAELTASNGDVSELADDHRAELERQMVASLAPRRNLVIATTSRTMLDADNVVALLGAEVFSLSAKPKDILARIELDGGAHPELLDTEDPAAELKRLLDERRESDERFTSIDTSNKSIDQVIDALRDAGAAIDDANAEAASPSLMGAASGEMDPTTRIFAIIIAAALAVLIVLMFLVLSF